MTYYNKMFGFVKLIFISATMVFGWYLPGANSLKCISMKNQKFKVRPQIVNVNSEEPVFFPFSIKISKCSGSRNNINIHVQNCAFLMFLKIAKLTLCLLVGVYWTPSILSLNFQHNNVLLTGSYPHVHSSFFSRFQTI